MIVGFGLNCGSVAVLNYVLTLHLFRTKGILLSGIPLSFAQCAIPHMYSRTKRTKALRHAVLWRSVGDLSLAS